MIACPNCGGELSFDIATQMLKCPFCDGVFAPTQMGEGKAAETQSYQTASAPQQDPYIAQEVRPQQAQQAQPQMQYQQAYAQQAEYFDVLSYTCPQCGGSIYSTEESLNGFCSYCGSSVMLEARMGQMQKPRKLIPFRIDKSHCKAAYESFVGKNFFAPGELRDPSYLERFRGIYMPYLVYDMTYKAPLYLKGTKTYRRGNYVYTEHYNCSCFVDSYYRGMSFDASASFDDSYSEAIAPFDAHTMVDFHPGYLSGYYADLADVSAEVYKSDALGFAAQRIFEGVNSSRCFPGVSVDSSQAATIVPALDGGGAYTAFFPVWFLSFRRGERVAYAVVNGQTGRVAGDVPVDKRRFLLLGGLIALIMYALLALFPAMTPTASLGLCGAVSVINLIMLFILMGKVLRRERREDDKGYLSRHDIEGYRKKQMKDRSGEKKSGKVLSTLFVVVAFFFFAPQLFSVLIYVLSLFSAGALSIVVLAAAVIMGGVCFVRAGKLSGGAGMIVAGLVSMSAVMIYNIAVQLVRPPGDGWYYGGAFALLAATIVCQLGMLEQYNMLTTRPLPQLNRRGGNDNAPV